VALGIDAVVGDREVLVKELQPPLFRVRHVSAAGLLGTGGIALILRPADLARSVRSTQRPQRESVSRAPSDRPEQLTILVVDDSITTRTMEKSLLEAEGYRVQVAVDGVDAWTLLKSEHFDLVLSDVDMPRMNGLDLTLRIRADDNLSDLPVVLVTALESREDKERGIEVGANAYVVKSSFDQANVLGTIRRLI
jgi:two-component system, chemotaxis family, sensor kinase CheA